MAKRKTFYVPAAIFEGRHSAYAVAVYAYLCFCSDKNGVCFPGMETIAAHCGMARSTVKKALTELEECGMIRSEATRQVSRSGKVRRGTNRYRLNDAPISGAQDASSDGVPPAVSRCTPPPCDGGPLPRVTVDPPPCDGGPLPRVTVDPPPCDGGPLPRVTVDPPPCGSGEINNNSKDIMGDVPSVGITAREDATGLDAIIEPLCLDSFFDQVFAQSVKQAIKTMYGLPVLSVNGTRVDNAAIRERLRLLTIDHIDYVEKQIDNYAGDVTSGERYLMACLYNAPIDCMVKNAKSG